MSVAPIATATGPARPATLVSLAALYRLLLRTQVTLPRLLGIGALGALALLIGLFARWDDDPARRQRTPSGGTASASSSRSQRCGSARPRSAISSRTGSSPTCA